MSVSCRTVLYCSTAVFLLLGALFCLKPGALWITDNGNKYIMMRHFAQGGGKIIPHAVPELFPTGGFHFIKVPEGAVSFYLPYLSALTAPFYALCGERGALVFPLLATLLLLGLAWKYWHIPPPVLLLSTPLFFYSLVLWEMTPGACLVLAALLLTAKKRFCLAGFLLGSSLLMREEGYFVCAALGGALLLTGRFRSMAAMLAGFLGAALPLWGYQWLSDGHFLGWHGKMYYLNNNAHFSLSSQVKVVFFNWFHHLFRFDGWGTSKLNWLAWSALLPLAAGALPKFKSCVKIKCAAGAVYLVCMAFLAAGVWFQKDVIFTASLLTGLFTATPVIAGFMINWRPFLKVRTFRVLTLFILLYTVAVPVLMTANDIGLVWGSRHFLVLLAPLVFLSGAGMRLTFGKVRGKLFFAAAAAVSIAIQIFGLYALERVSTDSFSVEQNLLARKEKVMVTDVFYIPEQMPRLFFEKTLLQVITPRDVQHLKKYLQKEKIKEVLLVLSPRFRQMDDAVLKELLTALPLTAPPEKVTGKSGFPDLWIAPLKSREAAGRRSLKDTH